MGRHSVWVCGAMIVCLLHGATRGAFGGEGEHKVFRAGAASIEITPRKLPAVISGGFLEGRADRVNDPLFARALVLDDGSTRLAIVIVDTLMMPRRLVDDAKRRAEKSAGVPADRILVAATHTHSAPSVMGALGTGVDEDYARQLPGWIAESIVAAAKNLAPAKIGWAVTADPRHTNCRRWIRRPDRIDEDPFGQRTVRAMMHPGYQNPDYIGPAGPVDAGLSVLAVQSPDGRPVALLANYSMHYFGAAPVSADYFGRFSRRMTQLLGAEKAGPPLVAMMSQGTAGDLHWMDYSRPYKPIDIDTYSDEVAKVALTACQGIGYRDWVPLAMAQRTLTLRRRVPDEARLAWARQVIEKMKGRTAPASIPEVYALDQVYLHKEPQRELVLQAVRIGELGITAMPAEVFGITGLKLKARSPLEPTFNLELANGAEGYIPPPEQHKLGGYTTWPARSAGLEVQAEPRIVEAVLQLLEQVSGQPRRRVIDPSGPYARAVLASKPLAYWRLGEFAGPQAADVTGHGHSGTYEDGIAQYLEGPEGPGFCGPGHTNRACHFAGGRLKTSIPGLGSTYTVEAWFWNGLPSDARPVTGYLFSRAPEGDPDAPGDHLGIGGTHSAAGKLIFCNGNLRDEMLQGTRDIPLRTWTFVSLVRDGRKVAVYLNGAAQPELSGELTPGCDPACVELFLGGRSDNFANFEGKLDEVAAYDRVLPAAELAAHYAAAKK